MKTRIVILSSHPYDPIAMGLEAAAERDFFSIQTIDITSFVAEAHSLGNFAFLWQGERYHPGRDCFVLNRIDPNSFPKLSRSDLDFGAIALRCYLYHCCEQFDRYASSLTAFRLGTFWSLPEQWQRIAVLAPELTVPSYSWGQSPDHWIGNADVYDYYQWKAGHRPHGNFISYQRPSGQAWSVLVIDDRIQSRCLTESEYSTITPIDLHKAAINCAAKLEQTCCELLFFHDHGQLCFGMCNPFPMGWMGSIAIKSAINERLLELQQRISWGEGGSL